ncbi:MAG: NifB/NifX family molybdenum-iron cluster-binding protein [Bacteroidales bacterium]|nr:NifB/NifX family molybdenum-iron cluster-binding protein [Bacteroidales bacterium]
MKKIAVPTRENVVDDHFGHCEYYTIYTVDDNNQVTDRSRLDSPQGCGCKSNIASVMEEMGISLMLAGNMGNGAYAKLTDHHIEVIRGCHGATEQVIQDYLAGKLHDSAEACDHHDCDHHHDEEQPVYHVAFPTQK